MKQITHFYGLLAAALAVVAVNAVLPQAKAYDFQYGFVDVYSPNALDYVVGQVNIQRRSEMPDPQNGISYWHPIANGTEARLTLQFTFPRPTTEISLHSGIGAWNFGGGNFGSGSLWASKNGSDWILLLDGPTPPGIDAGYHYDQNLPDSLIGESEIWIQARLNTSGWNIMAQFARQDTRYYNYNVFELDANLVTIPEPSSALLTLGGLVLLVLCRLTPRGIRRKP
ncbi:MAG TPA: hypothetical protein P5205_08725 [Candidatus Paceibacterota bacterium]|nr:hypothetical protein [Verrucomicrobiota bacterium]HSA10442.1 hypothetical protein [Candidatus Paceibacterota bacterium]